MIVVRGRTTSEDVRKAAVEMYVRGNSSNAVAKHFGISSNAVWNALREFGVASRGNGGRLGIPRKNKQFSDQDVIGAYVSGLSSKAVAEKFNTCGYTVLSILRKNGVHVRTSGPGKCRVPVRVEELKRRYEQGVSANVLAKECGVSHYVVQKALKGAGVELRGSKGNSFGNCDDNFFETIDTPEKAWVLGWMLSDGCVTGRNNIAIALHVKDRDVLEKLRKILKLKVSIKGDGRNCCYVSWKNKKMFEDLCVQGVVPRKSSTVEVPEIRGDLKRHVLRGIFEGDGCWTGGDISIVGSHAVCVWVRDVLVAHAFTVGEVRKCQEECLWRIGVYGKSAELVRAFMYDGVSQAITMDRKRLVSHGQVHDVCVTINYASAEKFLQDHHYLKKMPPACAVFGWYVNGTLRGVAAIGSPSSPDSAKTVFGKESDTSVYELRRFCLCESGKNDASRFLARVLRMWRREKEDARAVLTYAMDSEGHIGTLYQAMSAVYVGSANVQYVEVGGARTYIGRYADPQSVPSGSLVRWANRHKYIVLVNGARREDLVAGAVPYPKHNVVQ
jgi:hypothetical protein